MDLVNQIFRALHTIKGSGSMFGFEAIAAFTHEVESVFDMVRNGDVPATPVLCSLALRSRDQIRIMLESDADDDVPVEPEVAEDILRGLKAFVEGTDDQDEPVVESTGESEVGAETQSDSADEVEEKALCSTMLLHCGLWARKP